MMLGFGALAALFGTLAWDGMADGVRALWKGGPDVVELSTGAPVAALIAGALAAVSLASAPWLSDRVRDALFWAAFWSWPVILLAPLPILLGGATRLKQLGYHRCDYPDAARNAPLRWCRPTSNRPGASAAWTR